VGRFADPGLAETRVSGVTLASPGLPRVRERMKMVGVVADRLPVGTMVTVKDVG
jgi:hypothetical protein